MGFASRKLKTPSITPLVISIAAVIHLVTIIGSGLRTDMKIHKRANNLSFPLSSFLFARNICHFFLSNFLIRRYIFDRERKCTVGTKNLFGFTWNYQPCLDLQLLPLNLRTKIFWNCLSASRGNQEARTGTGGEEAFFSCFCGRCQRNIHSVVIMIYVVDTLEVGGGSGKIVSSTLLSKWSLMFRESWINLWYV